MLTPFFALAATSPGRALAFRRAVAAHLLVVGTLAALLLRPDGVTPPRFGQLLLTAGIAEGALLIGWRLTQLPKSQALEFLLVSPLRPRRFFCAEATVGLARLGLVTLSGLPFLVLLATVGRLDALDIPVLLAVPWTWGAVTGLGLTAWAYEPLVVRRWGERVLILGILFYLAVGVLAGENLVRWLAWLPPAAGQVFLSAFWAFHEYNPFGILEYWLRYDAEIAWRRVVGLEIATGAWLLALVWRSSGRLQGHFHDRHYRPAVDRGRAARPAVGDRPLAWWAVKRVSEYAGRINLWLAGGVGVLYALYTLAGPRWPTFLGRVVFDLFEGAGGIPMLATGLVLLAAVPAAFQYGLWDSSAQDRCRRLELLLLTRLSAADYWGAAAAAAWRRGRGYFAVALLLWLSAAVAGRVSLGQLAATVAAGVVLWGFYFTLGFRAFARGHQANGLGLLLTLGLPMLVAGLHRAGLPELAALLPPGAVHGAWLQVPLLGVLVAALAALLLARRGLAECDAQLRRWYDVNHGRKLAD